MKTLPYLRREHLLWAVRNVAAFITYWTSQIQGDLAKTPRLWAWRRTWKWRLVFAFIGATSWGLIAFGFNVVFDRLGNPTFATPALLFASQPPQDETNRRLWRANSHSGEVEVTLKWESQTDLDLHVVEPSAERIAFFNRRSASGGWLDVDENVYPTNNRPIEHVFWPSGQAPAGRFAVYVHHFHHHAGPKETAFQVELVRRHETSGERTTRQRFHGIATAGQPPELVTTFEVEPRPAQPWNKVLRQRVLRNFDKAARFTAMLFGPDRLELMLLSALWMVLGFGLWVYAVATAQSRFGWIEDSDGAVLKSVLIGALAGIVGQTSCFLASLTTYGLIADFLPQATPTSRALGLLISMGLISICASRQLAHLPRPLALLCALIAVIVSVPLLSPVPGNEAAMRCQLALLFGGALGLAVTPPVGVARGSQRQRFQVREVKAGTVAANSMNSEEVPCCSISSNRW